MELLDLIDLTCRAVLAMGESFESRSDLWVPVMLLAREDDIEGFVNLSCSSDEGEEHFFEDHIPEIIRDREPDCISLILPLTRESGFPTDELKIVALNETEQAARSAGISWSPLATLGEWREDSLLPQLQRAQETLRDCQPKSSSS